MTERLIQPLAHCALQAVNCLLLAGLLWLPAGPADAMTGVCVDAPGMPCKDISPGSGGDWQRPYVDPAVKEAERRERKRQKELRKRNNTPYQGVSNRIKKSKKLLSQILYRVTDQAPLVKSVTYEQVPGEWGTVFIPDSELGNLLLARPINPTSGETQLAAKQLAKVGALYDFMRHNAGSAEDAAFLAHQAAAIMVGGRSYVHISLSPSWQVPSKDEPSARGTDAFEKGAPKVSRLLGEIHQAQQRIRQSEQERTLILNQTRTDIKQLATLNEHLKSEPAPQVREQMASRVEELKTKIDHAEAEYFKKFQQESEQSRLIDEAANQLKRRVEWIKD